MQANAILETVLYGSDLETPDLFQGQPSYNCSLKKYSVVSLQNLPD